MNRLILFVALLTVGCSGKDPPGNGVFMLGVAFKQPITGTAIEGASLLKVTVAKIEALFDDGTSAVLMQDTKTFKFTGLASPQPVLLGEYSVRPGNITQIRLIEPDDQSIVFTFPKGTRTAKLPSGPQTGLKVLPSQTSSFPVVADKTTAVEIVFDAATQMIDNNGQGLIIHPTINGVLVDPSVFSPYPLDQYLVGFKPGTSATKILSIHAGFGAVILSQLNDIFYTLVRVPDTATPSDVFSYYTAKDEVSYVLPNFSLFPQRYANDGDRPPHLEPAFTDAIDAWDVVAPSPKRPGSHKILVAVADTGVMLNHPDLANNIYINQGEMKGWFGSNATPKDVDGDGVISFVDLNDPTDATNKAICDAIRANDGDSTSCGPLDLVNGKIGTCKLCTGPNMDQPPTDCAQGFGWQNGCDDDCDGKCDDLVGWDFTQETNLPLDVDGHGTKVAGEVGAVGNNGIDLVAPVWDVGIVPYKVVDDAGVASAARIVQFVDLARHIDGVGVDIANISSDLFIPRASGTPATACNNNDNLSAFATPLPDDKFGPAVNMLQSMWQSLGADKILFTVAAGNCRWNMDSVDTFVFPASLRKSLSLTNMLVVSSASFEGYIWSDTGAYNRGTLTGIFPRPIGPQSVDIAVTTDEGCVLTNDGKFTCTCGDANAVCAGTSFAAPAVAGVAALVLQAHPEFKSRPDLLQAKINSTAKPSPVTEPTDFPTPATAYISGGFVNALGAVQ